MNSGLLRSCLWVDSIGYTYGLSCFQVVKAEMVLWTAGFVLLTLVINAPLLPWVLRVTGLNKGIG